MGPKMKDSSGLVLETPCGQRSPAEGSCKRVWLGVGAPFQPLANLSKLPHLEENRAWNREGTESGGLPVPLAGRMGATGSILTCVETEPRVLGIEVFPALSSKKSTNCQELSLGSLVHTHDKYLLSFYNKLAPVSPSTLGLLRCPFCSYHVPGP